MAIEDLQQVDVKIKTLDNCLRGHDLSPPDLLKIDTEGAEVRVLRGAESLLSSDTMILCELHAYAWPGFDTSFEILKALVGRFGRKMRNIYQLHEAKGEVAYGCVMLER